MMGKTHLAVGMACGLLAVGPAGTGACLAALAGGALGGVAPDLDVRGGKVLSDAMGSRLAAAAIAIGAAVADWSWGLGTMEAILGKPTPLIAMGLSLTMCFVVGSALTSHRTFAHSLLGLAIMMCALIPLDPQLACAFAAGFVSHVALDTLNYHGVQVLWPLAWKPKLGICRSRGPANAILGVTGAIATVGLAALWIIGA